MLRLDETFRNPAKHLLRERKKLLGAWLQIASPIAAEIFAKAGVDVLLLDMEHGPNDILSLMAQMQAMGRFAGVPIVRAPWNDMVVIKRILDAGAYGVLVPYVNTRQEAEAAVAACKYPPMGVRGVAPSPRAPGWNMNSMHYLEAANEETLVMIAVETETAVEHIDDILQVEGLDGIFIGPMDLATSMGHFCDPTHPDVQAAIRRVEEAVLASDKFLASVAGGMEAARTKFDRGYSLVIPFADGGTLGAVAKANVETFHQMFPER